MPAWQAAASSRVKIKDGAIDFDFGGIGGEITNPLPHGREAGQRPGRVGVEIELDRARRHSADASSEGASARAPATRQACVPRPRQLHVRRIGSRMRTALRPPKQPRACFVWLGSTAGRTRAKEDDVEAEFASRATPRRDRERHLHLRNRADARVPGLIFACQVLRHGEERTNKWVRVATAGTRPIGNVAYYTTQRRVMSSPRKQAQVARPSTGGLALAGRILWPQLAPNLV
nr:unnamed protein product [Digitaria exilis]